MYIYIYIPQSSSCVVFQPLWCLTQISAPLGNFSPLEIFLPLGFPGSCQSKMICTPTLWFRKIKSKHQQSVGLRTSPENKVWKLHSCANPWQNNCFPRFQLSSLSVMTFEFLLFFYSWLFSFLDFWLLMTFEPLMFLFGYSWVFGSSWIFSGYSRLFSCSWILMVTHEFWPVHILFVTHEFYLLITFWGYSWILSASCLFCYSRLFSCSFFFVCGGYPWLS